MPYVPPQPGSTTPGQPTPAGVAKQDVHITDLPPEVRKSFLLSMVFFPSLVGGTICLIMFLGWWTLFTPKDGPQYAKALRSPDVRRRWEAARELAESIPNDDKKVFDPEVLTALIDILNNKDLDKETEVWMPAKMIKEPDERASRLRWWAANMVGLFAAKLPDQKDKDRGLEVLLKSLQEKDLAIFAAQGLSLLKDPRSREALEKVLANDNDPGARAAAAHALGDIGAHLLNHKASEVELNQYREPLRAAYASAKKAQSSNKDEELWQTVIDNTAIALARLKDATGKDRLEELTNGKGDAVAREYAKRALEALASTTDQSVSVN